MVGGEAMPYRRLARVGSCGSLGHPKPFGRHQQAPDFRELHRRSEGWRDLSGGTSMTARDERGFRFIPANGDYPGLTALLTSDGKEIVAMGIGPEVERVLLEKKGERHG